MIDLRTIRTGAERAEYDPRYLENCGYPVSQLKPAGEWTNMETKWLASTLSEKSLWVFLGDEIGYPDGDLRDRNFYELIREGAITMLTEEISETVRNAENGRGISYTGALLEIFLEEADLEEIVDAWLAAKLKEDPEVKSLETIDSEYAALREKRMKAYRLGMSGLRGKIWRRYYRRKQKGV